MAAVATNKAAATKTAGATKTAATKAEQQRKWQAAT